MARIRTIKPEFFTSEDIVSLAPLSRVFYIALWCEADREGRLSWKPRTLKMRYLPGDDCDVDTVAQELIELGLIVLYEYEGAMYAEIPSFKKHQVINNRESESSLPARVHDASSRVKAEGRKEGKGKERNNTPLPPLQGEIDGDDENEESDDQPAKPKRDSSTTLSTYLQSCSQQGCKAVPDDHFIRGWAETAGIDAEMMQVAWKAFRDDHISGGRRAKKYKDWPAAFANSVKSGWYRLWFIPATGSAEWTSQGRAAQRNYGEVLE